MSQEVCVISIVLIRSLVHHNEIVVVSVSCLGQLELRVEFVNHPVWCFRVMIPEQNLTFGNSHCEVKSIKQVLNIIFVCTVVRVVFRIGAYHCLNVERDAILLV